MTSYLELHFKKFLMTLFLLTLLQNSTSLEFWATLNFTLTSWVAFHIHQYQLYWILLHRTKIERTESATRPTVYGIRIASYKLETAEFNIICEFCTVLECCGVFKRVGC